MAKLVQITFDAQHPHDLAGWWAERLGLQIEENTALVQQLLDDGVVTDDDVIRIGNSVFFADAAVARDPDGAAPRMFFQRVPEPKSTKNRMHLDVPVAQGELDDEVAAWQASGASFVEFGSHPGHRWAVMRDPEGNEFCLH